MPLRDSIYITRGALEEIHFIWPVSDEPTVGCKVTEVVDRGQTILCGEFYDSFSMDYVVAVGQHEKATIQLAPDLANSFFDIGFTMNWDCN